MAHPKLTPSEVRLLQESLSSKYKMSNIRLREGEHQYILAKAIASFQLEMHFPDVKDIVNRLYGEEKTSDIQFIRKIQTILKKMEKSNIVQILPKRRPWDLQRYALTGFKFQDIDKNLVILATDTQMKQAQDMLGIISIEQEIPAGRLSKIRIYVLMLIVGLFYAASVWTLMQPIIDPIVFVLTFSVTAACSIMLGKALSHT